VATIGAVLTAHGKPYHYLLVNLQGEKLPYKFMATDIKPAPPLNKIQLTVYKILETKGHRALVSFYGYPRYIANAYIML